jgi:AcrR family transcriptional regulator
MRIDKDAMALRGGQTRSRIIDAAYRVFYKDGYFRAGVDAIAEAAHVTKRTLYYHFDSKDSLLAAVLANQNDLALARIRRCTEKARGEPAEIVAILFAEFEVWAKRSGWTGTGFTRVAMELADMPGHPARVTARRHKAAFEKWLATQFAAKQFHKPAVLARQIVLLIEGCNSLALIHGDVSYIKAASETARSLIKHQHSE